MIKDKWFTTFDFWAEKLTEATRGLREAILSGNRSEQAKAYDTLLKAQRSLVEQCECNAEVVGAEVGQVYLFEKYHWVIIKISDPAPYRSVTIQKKGVPGDEITLSLQILINQGSDTFRRTA